MSLHVHIASGGITIPPPAAVERRQVLWDWLTQYWGGGIRGISDARGGTPDVFRMGELNDNKNSHFTDMTEQIQFFCFGLFSITYYGISYRKLNTTQWDILANKLKALYSNKRAFNNGKGLDIKRNYVTRKAGDKHLSEGLPGIATIWTGGATGEGVKVINEFNEPMLKIRYFHKDAIPDPDSIDPFTDTRVFFATNIYEKRVLDGYAVGHFPMGVGGLYQDVPVPIIASRDIYYPYFDMRSCAGKPRPYFP
jgi:hypothetical protein